MALPLLESLAARQGFPLSESQIAACEAYRADLYEVNEVTNLTRIPFEEADAKHFADSLLVSEFIPKGANVLDIGPGPGFPAWVLACCRPDLEITALDSANKAIRFIERHPLANLKTKLARAEDNVHHEHYDVVIGRAVAPFAVQTEISAAWIKIGGQFIPFRTPTESEEIEQFPAAQLGLKLTEIKEIDLPGTDIVRLFPIFEKVKATNPEFPRQWGRIKAKPLQNPAKS
ncbi:MAG: RsmG family class I SAM-dependent methyltransferase [Fimbriimonadaceae bacterium]